MSSQPVPCRPRSPWSRPPARGERWKGGQQVIAVRGDQRGDALVLRVQRLVERQSYLVPRPGSVDHQQERRGALAVGTERDASGLVGAGEEGRTAVGSPDECRC